MDKIFLQLANETLESHILASKPHSNKKKEKHFRPPKHFQTSETAKVKEGKDGRC